MGKNIGGTLGGPLEGRMELMDIKGYTQTFVSAVENDDLDLQLVNLHCVEQNGGRADVQHLSREWLDHVHFEFDEYGHALTNMRRDWARRCPAITITSSPTAWVRPSARKFGL